MSATTVTLLMLASAFLAAVTHALINAGADRLAVRALVSVTCGIIAAPLLLIINPLPNEAIFWLALVGPTHLIYHFVLIRAYSYGDFPLIFPLARGLAPLLLLPVAILLTGDEVTIGMIVGTLFIAGGLVWLCAPEALRTDRRAFIFALITAVMIATYTLFHGFGLRAVVRVGALPLDYIVWFFIIDGVLTGATTLFLRRHGLPTAFSENWRAGLAGGFFAVIVFSIALWVLAIYPIVAVAALRETRVIFAAIIGALVYREAFGVRRVAAALCVALGVIAINI